MWWKTLFYCFLLWFVSTKPGVSPVRAVGYLFGLGPSEKAVTKPLGQRGCATKKKQIDDQPVWALPRFACFIARVLFSLFFFSRLFSLVFSRSPRKSSISLLVKTVGRERGGERARRRQRLRLRWQVRATRRC